MTRSSAVAARDPKGRQMNIRLASSIVVGLVAGSAGFLACSSRDGFDVENQEFEPTLDAGAGPEAASCGIHCSRDLKQVLDGCEGSERVVEQCNADQGCGAGKCVDACTAAELTKGSAGCNFWTVPPDEAREARGSCFAAIVANTWDRGVSVSAEVGSGELDISNAIYVVDQPNGQLKYTPLGGERLAPGQVAVVFFAHDSATLDPTTVRCPATVTPALLVDPVAHGTGKTRAFHITTDAPVSAYSIYPYGGAASNIPSATLLLPVSSWAKNYVTVSPFDFGDTKKRRTLQIIANEDGTEVTMKPTVAVPAGKGVAGAVAGVAQTWALSKGEVLQFVQRSLAGSPIEATKPIGVFGGAECTQLPTPYCDTLQQQIPPFAHWGSEYAVVPFRPRIGTSSPNARERVPYTIVGAADGTVLTYEPSRPRDAPETLATGEVGSFITDQIFVVRSQDSRHPFHVNVYMTGAEYNGGAGDGGITPGDPDFVNVPPTEQYLDRYVFFADHTFPETTLTLVRTKTAGGFMPVELGCAGEIGGWMPLGSSGRYEFTWVTLTKGSLPQKFGSGSCGYGRHEARSRGPFAVTVWGTGMYTSYGYVGGVGLRPVNDAPPPPVK